MFIIDIYSIFFKFYVDEVIILKKQHHHNV